MSMHGSSLEAKLVILGSQGVGKTSLVMRYVQNTFSPHSASTIGASFLTQRMQVFGVIRRGYVDDCRVVLQIWDTAGQERFRSMAPMYYRGANAAILVYDITSEQSFQDISSWVEELQRNTGDIDIHVVGSKLDLAEKSREVPQERAQAYVRNTLGSLHDVHEVSAKDATGVDELFHDVTRSLVERTYEIERTRRERQAGDVQLRDGRQEASDQACCNV
ncbi:ras-related protein rab-5C-like protein [Thamnocephalis sphaerospora]|uniref:Ras-related protein rab-5C-like protein n=1 Tax=Thamnocephalis sphaerospora TaxID=78915 RepID=A0A4P9XXL5_9FUNG|nr:ras-related protein rab-5C-like protein [Thamnocephalis sphaerospora]|eukprot:RKP11193.1 ras-related protein rab-5C-like protein [Thamnocephalis sphaerospora]